LLLQKGKEPNSEQVIWLVLGNDYLPIEPIQQYLNHLINLERSPNTVNSYARWLKTYWEYLEAKKLDWREVNIEDLAMYLRWLRIGDGNEVIRSEKTVNHAMTVVKVFYEFHTHRGNVGNNKKFTRYNLSIGTPRWTSFLSGIAKSKPREKSLLKLKEPKKFRGCLSKQEIQTLIKACNRKRDQLIIKILYETGMRKGEILGLRLEDMGDCGENEIAIVTRKNRNGARVKNNAQRVVNVSKELMQVYEDYLIEEYPDIEPDFLLVNIWGGEIGEPMNYRSLNYLFQQLEKKTGIHVYPHLFRHTHATELIKAGVNIYHISKRLGHGSISTTLNEYGHLTKEDLKIVFNEEK
jgi:site-specific recombinase XerD